MEITLGKYSIRIGKSVKNPTALPMSQWGASASRWGNWFRNLLLPGATLDYKTLAGDRWRNSIVAASILWINRNQIQAPYRVYTKNGDGDAVPLPNHPLEKLLRRPNPQYDGDTLRKAIMLSLIAGASNAYVWIKRDRASGCPLELWYIPHMQIWPVWNETADTDKWIDYYNYRNMGIDTPIPVEDVIHFRDGIDPYNQRLGLDLLDSGSREVVSDNEASGYLVSMLRNMGITPVIITPDDPEVTLEKDERELIKEEYSRSVGGDNRFKPMVGSRGVKVQQIQLSPHDMLLDTAQDNPEARLTALIGVPAVVLGLKVGLEHSTYSNMEEARRAAWEDGIIPRNMLICSHFTHQLVPDFERDENAYVDADYSKVKALQDNQTDLIQTLTKAAGRPVLSVNEARERLGYKGVKDGDKLHIAAPPVQALPSGAGHNARNSDDDEEERDT